MAAKLIVKKEYLDSEIHFGINGGSQKVILKSATQEQLNLLKKAGKLDSETGHDKEIGDFDHIFEKEAKEK